MYEHYNTAKRALASGTSSCQIAEDLAQNCEAMLSEAVIIANQITFLHTSIVDQVGLLENIALQLEAEESDSKSQFNAAFKDLDRLDGDLNSALEVLHSTLLPDVLIDARTTASSEVQKSLFEFADDEAVESLKGRLRQMIDEMHEAQETLTTISQEYLVLLQQAQKVLATAPSMPMLTALGMFRRKSINETALQPKDLGLPAITRSYHVDQADRLHQMADLLVQLSQHYDHSCTLFKSTNSLGSEEIEELQVVVENDAAQLEDVISELDDQVVAMEEDCEAIKAFLTALNETLKSLIVSFECLEDIEIDSITTRLKCSRSARSETSDTLDLLREQLIGLTVHYRAFGVSYDAMLVEIDRRRRYERGIEQFILQSEDTLQRLVKDEKTKRDKFIQRHGESLPSDIWSGITSIPSHFSFVPEKEELTPALPESIIEAAITRLSLRKESSRSD